MRREIVFVAIEARGSSVCASGGVTGGGDSVSLGPLVGESLREIALQSAMDSEPSTWGDITTAGGVAMLTVFDNRERVKHREA